MLSVYNNYIDSKLELSNMETKTFILFAAEVISENMNYLADADDGAEIDSSLEQNEKLMELVKRAMLEGVEPADLVQSAINLMHWNIVAWADSEEFKLHELANRFLDEVGA